MVDDLIGRSSEASKGGFQGILKLQGLLASVERKPSSFETSSFGTGPPKDQAEVVLEDTIILEMEEGEPEPDLTDDKFTFWMNYAAPGKPKAHQNTFFVKGFCASAEAVQKEMGNAEGGYKDFIGTVVTLERQRVFLFKRPSKEEEGEDEEFYSENFVFASGGDESPEDMDDHLRGLMVGKNQAATLRAVMMDVKGKRLGSAAEIRTMFTDGSLAKRLGLERDEEDEASKYSLAE